MDLEGKTVLVTGGGRRIGAAIARLLAEAGMEIVVHYRHSRESARDLCAEIRMSGKRAWAIQADLEDVAAGETLLEKAKSFSGRLDGLVNNASLFEPDTIRAMDSGQVDRLWRINFHAPVLLMKKFAACCAGGAIVNMLDRRIVGYDTAHASYVMTRKALAAATRLAALELAPPIRVNAVAPGAILPPPEGTHSGPVPGGPVPLNRQCTAEEVAAAVKFLLSCEAITGQTLFIDGGQHLLGGDVIDR